MVLCWSARALCLDRLGLRLDIRAPNDQDHGMQSRSWSQHLGQADLVPGGAHHQQGGMLSAG